MPPRAIDTSPMKRSWPSLNSIILRNVSRQVRGDRKGITPSTIKRRAKAPHSDSPKAYLPRSPTTARRSNTNAYVTGRAVIARRLVRRESASSVANLVGEPAAESWEANPTKVGFHFCRQSSYFAGVRGAVEDFSCLKYWKNSPEGSSTMTSLLLRKLDLYASRLR